LKLQQFFLDSDTYQNALSDFLIDSNYEIEVEQNMSRGKRKKKIQQISSSDNDSNIPLKIAKISILAHSLLSKLRLVMLI